VLLLESESKEMESDMHILETEKLQIGMTLGENIYRNEQLVISEGVILNSRHIQMLKRMSIVQVKVLEELSVKKEFPVKKEISEKYKSSVESFKKICYGVTIGNFVVYDEVKDCLDPLIQELETKPEMALKLWQIYAADFYTYEHSVKVCMLSILLAKWMNKPQVFIDEIGKVGLLHDIGKCNIPNEILNKPDVLTEEEFSVMKTHSTLGYVLLSSTKELGRDILKGVLHHHERFDGTGYPAKLSGKSIPEYARIVSVVDVFDAMTSNRIYREKMNPYKVFEIMSDGSSGALDPDISNFFLDRIKRSYLGELVLLNSGEVAKIHNVESEMHHRPIIELNGEIVDLKTNQTIEIKSLFIN